MKITRPKPGQPLRKRLRTLQSSGIVSNASKKKVRGRRALVEEEDVVEVEETSPSETTEEEEEEEEEEDDEEDENLTDTDGTLSEAASGAASRRSQRSRPLDIDRSLVVLLPDDDVGAVLGISEEEATEWVFDYAHDEESSHKPHHKHQKLARDELGEVVIPGVKKIPARSSTSHKGTFKLPASFLKAQTVVAGAEYDLDSEDEAFLAQLNQSQSRKKPLRSDNGKQAVTAPVLPADTFEHMIEVLERELHLARSRRYSYLDILEAKRYQEDVATSASSLHAAIQGYLTRHDSKNLQRVIDANQRRESVAAREDHYTKHLQSTGPQPRPVGRPPGNVRTSEDDEMYNKWHSSSNTARNLTSTEVENLVPLSSALQLLRTVYEFDNSKAPPSDTALALVYSFWKNRVCNDSCSRLRCFHDFIMENWSPFGTLPFIPDDNDETALLNAYSNLQAIRFDLERVRLMLDCVRKREKIKREMIREMNIATDELLNSTKRTQAAINACSYRVPEFDPEEFAKLHTVVEQQEDEAPAAPVAKVPERQHSLTSASSSTSGWAEEEDRALMIAVAQHGIGRWTKIREDLHFTQSSAQMSQRFARLARNQMRKIGKADSVDGPADVFHTKKAKSSWLKSLSADLLNQLENFDEFQIWEEIAQRHLEDQRNCAKRSGRPVKYPIAIPVPDNVMKRLQSNLLSKNTSRTSHTTHIKRALPKGSEHTQATSKKRPRNSLLQATRSNEPSPRTPNVESNKKRKLRSQAN